MTNRRESRFIEVCSRNIFSSKMHLKNNFSDDPAPVTTACEEYIKLCQSYSHSESKWLMAQFKLDWRQRLQNYYNTVQFESASLAKVTQKKT